MDFDRYFTRVQIAPSERPIGHTDPVWTVGSCFSDEIGGRMAARGFAVEVNPLGTLYNPASICRQLRRVAAGEPYTAADLFEHEGLWHSPDFHTSFSAPAADEALVKINGAIERLHTALPSLHTLMLTLGSARAFRSTESGEIVANCHKLPAERFTVVDLEVAEIVSDLSETLRMLRRQAPGLRTVITVSPIRHKAYGLHADRLSKARLLLAADRLCEQGEAEYFPAYEIMNDELRDYRFYAADMIHPSETAADHIYSRFAEAYFSAATRDLAAAALKQYKRSLHRPITRT